MSRRLNAVGARFDFAKVQKLDEKIADILEKKAHNIKDNEPEKTEEDPTRPGRRRVKDEFMHPINDQVRTDSMQEFLKEIYKEEEVPAEHVSELDSALGIAYRIRRG